MRKTIAKKELELKINLGEGKGTKVIKFKPPVFRFENPEEMIESAGGLAALVDYVNPTFVAKIKTKARNFLTAFFNKEENASKTDEEAIAAMEKDVENVTLKDFIRSAEGTAARAKKADEAEALLKEFEGQDSIPLERLRAILAGV